jgi:hypothetical protein
MLLILNNLMVPLSFNYQHFLLFFGELFFISMLLFILLDTSNPKFEIIPSPKLTNYTLKLNFRVYNVMALTFLFILINTLFFDTSNFQKTH